jgi:WD40 repeat protein
MEITELALPFAVRMTGSGRGIVLNIACLAACVWGYPYGRGSAQTPAVTPSLTLAPGVTRGEVSCIGFNADGRLFFMGTLNSWVHVWTADGWRELLTRKPPPPPQTRPGEHHEKFRLLDACSISPRGRSFALASGDSISVFALPSGEKMHEIRLWGGALAYSPDERRLAVGHRAVVQLWDTHTWTKVEELTPNVGDVSALAFSSDGRFLSAGSARGAVCVWNMEHRTEPHVCRLSVDEQMQSDSLSFSADGGLVASAVWNQRLRRGLVHIWSTGSGDEVVTLGQGHEPLRTVAFSPDGAVLAAANDKGVVRFWRTVDWRERCSFSAGDLSEVVYSPDSKWLATGGGGETVSIWKNPPCQ